MRATDVSRTIARRAERRFITQQTAAERADCTDRTIRNWVARGYLTGYRTPSGAIRIDPDELERVLTGAPIPTGGGQS